MTVELTDRFWSKVLGGRDVVRTDECWLWTGAVQSNGYGCWGVNGKSQLVHRVAYEALVGPIPGGMTLDHLCHTESGDCAGGKCQHRLCCNPAHLEPVTAVENSRRAPRNQVTECPQGHPYDADNTIISPKGTRSCRTCQRDARRLRDGTFAIRQWAAEQGYQLGEVGPIPRQVKAAFTTARRAS